MDRNPAVDGRLAGAGGRWSVGTYLLVILLVGAVAVAGATVYGYVWSSSQARSDATSRMKLQARRAAAAVASSIATSKTTAAGLAAQTGLATLFLSPKDCQLSASGTEAFPSIRIDIVAADGRIACSSDSRLTRRTGPRAPRHSGAWLQRALRSSGASVSFDAYDTPTHAPAAIVAVPIPGKRAHPGVVAVVLALDPVGRSLAHNFGGAQHASSFTLVRRTDPAVVSDSELRTDPRGRARFAHTQPTGDWTGLDGSRRLYGSADVAGSDWRIYSGVRRSVVLAEARGTLTRQALVGIVALLILALAAWLLKRRVAGPLRAITRAVLRAGGEPGAARAAVGGTSETASLAAAFNAMLDVRSGHEAQLVYQATHDQLTGLPNRALLHDQLDSALLEGADGVAVLWLGVDRLDVVNNSFGHGVGDRVLIEVAGRLQAELRSGDTLARFGGGEFVMLCEGLAADEAIDVATRLQGCLDNPFSGPDGGIVLKGAIGIAEAQQGHASPGQLLREADTAMREARNSGRTVCRFDRELQSRATRHLEVEHALWHALRRNEFVVHYQPLLELATGHIIGAEALVRWRHPERGIVPPLEFIPTAEQTGQIVEIGQHVLATACRQAAAWRTAGHPMRMSVNVAVDQLRHDGFSEFVTQTLTDTGLPADQLCLEITESSLINETGRGADTIRDLRAHGVLFSIDDFGTGYSSLSYLHEMPINELKIDRSFVGRLDHDERDRHLVEAIISMARALKLTIVAEGVETAEQRRMLAQLQCGFAQGYLFAAPQAPDDLSSLLDAQRARQRMSVVA